MLAPMCPACDVTGGSEGEYTLFVAGLGSRLKQSCAPLGYQAVYVSYGLDHILIKQPEPYTVARFMWHIYHNEDKDGRRGHKYGSAHMLEITKHLFERFFHKGRGLEVSNDSSINGDYLLVKADDYKWPLFFELVAKSVLRTFHGVEPQKGCALALLFSRLISHTHHAKIGWYLVREQFTAKVCAS